MIKKIVKGVKKIMDDGKSLIIFMFNELKESRGITKIGLGVALIIIGTYQEYERRNINEVN